jgi:hypothetical protein
MTKCEQETIIRWDEESRTVTVWSASRVVLRKLARLGLTPTRESRRRTGELHGREYRVPLTRFRWGLKSRRKGRFLPRKPHMEASLSTERGAGHIQVAPGRKWGPETA